MKKILLIICIFIYSCCSNKHVVYENVDDKNIHKIEPEYNQRISIPEDKQESKNNSAVDTSSIPQYIIPDTIYATLKPIKSTQVYNKINNNPDSNIIESISKGDINYVINDTMVIGIINKVDMTISINVDKQQIIDEVSTFTENNLYTESIRISPVMKARLIDPSGVNFKIISKTSEEQFLEYGDYTRWTWDVTPLLKGNNELSLVVDIIYKDKSKSIQVFDGIIYVYSNETLFQKIYNFLKANWQYLLSTLLIPLLIWIFNKYRKKRI